MKELMRQHFKKTNVLCVNKTTTYATSAYHY